MATKTKGSSDSTWQSSEYYDGEDFLEFSLNGGKLTDTSFNSCEFNKCNFKQAKLCGCTFDVCTFLGCDFNAAKLPDCRFNQCVFNNCRLSGIDWTLAEWPMQPLPEMISFEGCQLSHASFFGLKMSGMKLTNCTAHNTDFANADLSKADLRGTDFERSTFSSTNLFKADLRGALNYYIDLASNRITKAHFSHPEVMNLLSGMDIIIE